MKGFNSQGGPCNVHLPQTFHCFPEVYLGVGVGPIGAHWGPCATLTRSWQVLSPVPSPVPPQQETGFWFIFHHVPTGPSEGMYSPGYSEHIPLGKFHNNRAHSNYRVSLPGTQAGAGDTGPVRAHLERWTSGPVLWSSP